METGAISHSEIDVTVTDPAGARLHGVTGILSATIIGQRDEISNTRGQMVFRDLPPGAYVLEFSLAGFETVHREVTIHEDGESDPLEITMSLAKG